MRMPVCLLYHRVADVDYDPLEMAVSVARFRAHLEVLCSTTYVLSPLEFRDGLRRRQFPERSVLLTFDDGYVDNQTAALPLLEDAGVPAVFFVLFTPTGESRTFWWDTLFQLGFNAYWANSGMTPTVVRSSQLPLESLMSEMRRVYAQLRCLSSGARTNIISKIPRVAGRSCDEPRTMSIHELALVARSRGIHLASHGYYHEPLSRIISKDELKRELWDSRIVRERLGPNVLNWYAYPFGVSGRDFDYRSMSAVVEADYEVAFAVANGVGEAHSQFSISRHTVKNWDATTFRLRLEELFKYNGC